MKKDKLLYDAAVEFDELIDLENQRPRATPLRQRRRLATIRLKLKQYAKQAAPASAFKLAIRKEVLLAYDPGCSIEQAPEMLRQLAALVRDDDRASALCRSNLSWAIIWLQRYVREQDHLKNPKENPKS